jgi:hypothetical protein
VGAASSFDAPVEPLDRPLRQTTVRALDRRSTRVGALLLPLVALALIPVGVHVASSREPAAFRQRSALPSCGSVEAGLGGELPRGPARCLSAALRAGAGAELRVVLTTVEGDPVLTWYRALPGGGAEVFTDGTRDSFGPGDWARASCPAATSVDALGTCTSQPLSRGRP